MIKGKLESEIGGRPGCNLTSESLLLPDALLTYIPKSARSILDYGCGDGLRGSLMHRRNQAAVYGVEPDERLADAAEPHLDVVWRRPLDKTPLPLETGSLDCVLGVDLLPRLRDPEPVLREIHRVLHPDGIFAGTVPNLQYYRTVLMLADGRWDYEDRGIMAREHLRFFTFYEILNLFKSLDFNVLHVGSLVFCSEEDLPLDENRCLHFGRITIGPLDEKEYVRLRTEQFLVLAQQVPQETTG